MKSIISKYELKSALFMMESLLQSSSSDKAVRMKSIKLLFELQFYKEPMLLAPKTLGTNLLKLCTISLSLLRFSLLPNSIC